MDEARLQELVIDMVSSYLCDAHVKLLREAVAVAGGGGGAVPNKEGAAESGGGKSKENASPQRGVAVGIKSSAFVQPNRIATNSNKVEGEPPVKKAKVDKPKVAAHGMFGMFGKVKAMKKK